MSDRYQPGTLNPQFNKEAKQQDEFESELQDRDQSVNDTASQELYLRDRFSAEHDAIDEHYRSETAKLAGAPLNTPTLGLGSDDPEVVQQKYEALTTQWSRDRERLATFEDYSTDRVRSEGTTLSGEFEASAAQIGLSHDQGPANDAGELQRSETQIQFERSSNANGRSM